MQPCARDSTKIVEYATSTRVDIVTNKVHIVILTVIKWIYFLNLELQTYKSIILQ